MGGVFTDTVANVVDDEKQAIIEVIGAAFESESALTTGILDFEGNLVYGLCGFVPEDFDEPKGQLDGTC